MYSEHENDAQVSRKQSWCDWCGQLKWDCRPHHPYDGHGRPGHNRAHNVCPSCINEENEDISERYEE